MILITIEVNPNLGKKVEEDKNYEVENNTEEDSIELDDEEAEKLHSWGGPECDRKIDWGLNSDDLSSCLYFSSYM